MYGVKLHLLLCATNRVPISYDELAPANDVADVCVAEELVAEAALGRGRRGGCWGIWPTGARGRKKHWPRWESFWRRSVPSGDAG